MADHLKTICKRYDIPFCDADRNSGSKGRIKDLFASGAKIKNGSRNNDLFHLFRNIITQNHEILPEEQVKKMAYEANQTLCETSLPNSEFETIWKSAQNYVSTKHEEERKKFTELVGNMFYKIGEVPARYIIPLKKTKQLTH